MRRRANTPVIVAYGLAAALIGGTYAFFTQADSPETAEERRQSMMLRQSISTYLPLTREMVMAAPEAAYNYTSTIEGTPQSMRDAFDIAEKILGHGGIGQIFVRCDNYSYLRAVHKQAVENYIAAGTETPGLDIAKHRAAAEAPVITAPLCKIR